MSPVRMSGLVQAFSAERLAKYTEPGDDEATVLARYTWNQALADEMSLAMQVFEVTLRNAVYRAGTATAGVPARHGGVPCWLDAAPTLLKLDHGATVSYAREELRRRGVPRTPGRLIAELSLGFWVLLFGAYYDQAAGLRGRDGFRLWTPSNLKSTFPNVPHASRDREALRKRFDSITKYRNRLAHHEPIFHLHPGDRYQELIAAIRWINADAAEYAESLSRLPDVLAAGPGAFLERIKQLLA